MKKTVFVTLLLLALALSLTACWAAKEKAQKKSAEKIAAELIKQSTGAQDVDIDLEHNSASITYEDGSSITVEIGEKVDLKTFSAMGYQIPLPDGVISGVITRWRLSDVDDNVTKVTGSFQTDGSLSRMEIFLALDKALTAQGFKFYDPLNTDTKGLNDDQAPDFSHPRPENPYLYRNNDGVGFAFTSSGENQFVISGIAGLR